MAYTSKAQVQRLINVDITSDFDTQIDTWITAIETWIERYVGKSFEAASATRYYTGNGLRSLVIDPFTAITSVDILDEDGDVDSSLTEGAGNDYITAPLNDTEKYELILTSSARIGSFPSRVRGIKVVATFGASNTVPSDVQLAATKLLLAIIEEGLKGGDVTQQQLGDFSATYRVIDERAEALGVYNILDQYRDLHI